MLYGVAKPTSKKKLRRKPVVLRTVTAANSKRVVTSRRAPKSKPANTGSRPNKNHVAVARNRAAKAAPRHATSRVRGTSPSAARPAQPIPTAHHDAEQSLSTQVAATIVLALHDDENLAARERELASPPSAWTLAGRARRVHTQWTR